jgi:hypothetical protein
MPFPLNDSTRAFIERHFRKRLLWTEDWFLSVLEGTDKKYDVYWAVLALRDCGSLRSVPVLKTLLHFPMQDVKCCSILTIAHIAKEAESVFYGKTLIDPSYREKGYAMWAIRDAADERATDSVLLYFRENRSKLRAGRLINGTVVDGIEYLHRVRDRHQGAREFLNNIETYWDRLGEGERTEISKRVPNLFTD